MFFEILKWTIISFTVIVLIHYLFIFFKDNLTIPKTKDLVSKPLEKYKIMETITNNNFTKLNSDKLENNILNNSNNNNLDGTTMLNNLIASENNLNNQDNMKDELKSFFTNLNDI